MNITRKFARISATLLAVLPLAGAWSWDGDIHYHLNYYLAHQTGFSTTEASLIAGAAQYVDYYPLTDPVAKVDESGIAQEQRRFFHFPKWDYYSEDDTLRNSFFGRYNVEKAIQDAASSDPAVKALSPYRFGMAIHVLADTYSHEGFSFLRGHAFSGGDWHNPDRPYHNYVNIQKAVEVSKLILGDMQTFYQAFKGKKPNPVNWNAEIRPFVLEVAALCVGTYKDDYEEEIAQRSACWEKHFKEKNLDFTSYNQKIWDTGNNNQQFVSAFQRYCLPHKSPTQKDGAAQSGAAQSAAASGRRQTARLTVLPAPDQYCATLDQEAGNDPLKVADLLLDAPWLIQADCVQEAAANPVVLAAVLDAVNEVGLNAVYPVSYLFDHSAATAETKTALLRQSLSSTSLDQRLFAATMLLKNDQESNAAQKVLFDAWNSAPNAATRERVFAYIPTDVDFLPIFSAVLTDGSPTQKTQAAHALFQMPESTARTVLRQQAWQSLGANPTDSGPTYWLIMGLDPSSTELDIWSARVNQSLLIQLLQNSQAANIVKPAVYALRSYYPTTAPQQQERIAHTLIDALKVQDPLLRWHVGYSLVDISGVDFDLSPQGLSTIQTAAEAWYQQTFDRPFSD